MEISKILKNKRTELDMTQGDLAKSLYVSKRSITNWETGRTTPDIDSLIRLSKLYDISLDDLLLNNKNAVDNVKKQAQLKLMNIYLAATFITLLAFLFILGTTGLYGDLSKPVYVITWIGAISNNIAMVYFLDQINKLENKSEKQLLLSALKWTLLGLTIVILSIIIIIMIKYGH
ncbi:helix-turn-helix domain-containing protein [Companilactobacillus jidongensis]|uniref:helix-turn-helix domain-containing protein n=1 Tax=Companilactobacillus jidongensis TaxID=2486006 RepID=UPI000F7868ED|nr:helix-turn-helix transcriptional regulator [Companilactobacillus jidongensis]